MQRRGFGLPLVEGIFPLELTSVVTPFRKTLSGERVLFYFFIFFFRSPAISLGFTTLGEIFAYVIVF